MNTIDYTPIRTDSSNLFAHQTMRERQPDNIQMVLDRNPDYSQNIQDQLKALRDSLPENAVIPPPETASPDADAWERYRALLRDTRWLDTWWFFAEHSVFRLIVGAVRYWETARDPYAPIKQDELSGDALADLTGEMAAVVRDDALDPDEQLHRLLGGALWGNRIDLSYMATSAHGTRQTNDDDLLVDDRQRAVTYLRDRRGLIHLVVDNAGSELVMDLLLTDALLQRDFTVMLHVKMHPTFVSDATTVDTRQHIDWLVSGRGGEDAAVIGRRLQAAFEAGTLRIIPDFYWNSPLFLYDLPLRLRRTFADACLVILKGDANYRRAVNDTIFPVEMPFAAVTASFPVPLLALRTLKSDPVVGLAAGLAAKLDGLDDRWRVNGRRGVIQLKA